MGTAPLDAEIKTRVPKSWAERLQKLADREHLKVSDIVRRAIDQLISAKTKPEAASK